MQIDVMTVDAFQILQGARSLCKLIRPHADIAIAIRPQAPVGIEASNSPAFNEYWFNASVAQQRKNVLDLSFMNQSRKAKLPVSLVQLQTSRRRSERRMPDTPPTQSRASCLTKQRRDLSQLGFRKVWR